MRSARRRNAEPGTAAALALFGALTTAFGIAAHLVSELVGLGAHDDADVMLSARHGYLALIALASLAAVVATLAGLPRHDRRAIVSNLVRRLPMRGEGPRFVVLSFAAQFGFFAATQLGEGCPLCSGDVVVGVLAAAVAALAGALAVAACKRRFCEIAVALAWRLALEAPSGAACARAERLRGAPCVRPYRGLPFAFRYRPPPAAAAH